jgi:hypothetical protein
MTIRPYTYSLCCFLLFFYFAHDLQGQVKDFQTWWEMEMDKEITSKLDLNAELEQRFKNNSLQYSRTLLSVGASYDLLDYLSVAGGARIIFTLDGDQELRTRYRFHFDAGGGYDLSGFDLSLRLRFQYGFDELMAFRYLNLNALVNRNRLKVARHVFGTKFDWFVSLESWHGSGIKPQWQTYAMRYSAGISYSINFTSSFSLRYILEDEFNVINPLQMHVLVMGYSYSF